MTARDPAPRDQGDERCLQKLVCYGVLARHVLDDRPPHVEYRLTRRGRAQRPLLRRLERIVACWDAEPLPPSQA